MKNIYDKYDFIYKSIYTIVITFIFIPLFSNSCVKVSIGM